MCCEISNLVDEFYLVKHPPPQLNRNPYFEMKRDLIERSINSIFVRLGAFLFMFLGILDDVVDMKCCFTLAATQLSISCKSFPAISCFPLPSTQESNDHFLSKCR